MLVVPSGRSKIGTGDGMAVAGVGSPSRIEPVMLSAAVGFACGKLVGVAVGRRVGEGRTVGDGRGVSVPSGASVTSAIGSSVAGTSVDASVASRVGVAGSGVAGGSTLAVPVGKGVTTAVGCPALQAVNNKPANKAMARNIEQMDFIRICEWGRGDGYSFSPKSGFNRLNTAYPRIKTMIDVTNVRIR